MAAVFPSNPVAASDDSLSVIADWQQLQHLSAAAAALNQQHMLALSNQNQQMAALAQYQMHVQAAAQLVKPAGATLPGLQARPRPLHGLRDRVVRCYHVALDLARRQLWFSALCICFKAALLR